MQVKYVLLSSYAGVAAALQAGKLIDAREPN
jgi:hypothetical protein